jgi:hypothetical protein
MAIICYFCMIQVSCHVFRNSYSPLTCCFKSLWSQKKFVVEVIIIGCGLPDFLGAFCSGSLRVHVSSSDSSDFAFGGSLTAANVGSG